MKEGQNQVIQNYALNMYHRYGLDVKTTFFTQYLSNLNPEGEVYSSKIDGFKGNYISKLKWVWQA